MKRSEIYLPEYFDRYILKCDDVTIMDALEISLTELENSPLEKWKALGNHVYAPGKWTLKDILQHVIDTERVFAFRALSFARGDRNVPSMEEDEYAKQAQAVNRSLDDLLEEAVSLRKSTILMYKSFTPEMLSKTGIGFKGEYSVAHIGFIFGGHQRWHFEVIEERYFRMPGKFN